MQKRFKAQFGDLKPVFLWVYAPICLGILVIVVAGQATGVPLSWLTRDPLAVTGGEFYIGVISNLGILFWCAAATVCFFTAGLVSESDEARRSRSFLLFGGALTTLLCLDDLFMFHEIVFPRYFHWKEGVVVLSYGLLLLAYLWRFRKIVLNSHFVLLVLASLFFGFSVVFDRLPQTLIPGHHLFEDGSKLLGIVSWFAYYLVFCYEFLVAKFVSSGESNAGSQGR